MAKKQSTRRRSTPSTKPHPAALALAIDAQRRQLFQVSATLAALSCALDDVSVPGHEADAPDFSYATDALIAQVSSVCTALDPTTLRLGASTRAVQP